MRRMNEIEAHVIDYLKEHTSLKFRACCCEADALHGPNFGAGGAGEAFPKPNEVGTGESAKRSYSTKWQPMVSCVNKFGMLDDCSHEDGDDYGSSQGSPTDSAEDFGRLKEESTAAVREGLAAESMVQGDSSLGSVNAVERSTDKPIYAGAD